MEAFYDKIAADLLSFVTAQAKGEARAWVREYFEDSLAPYDMTAGETALGIVYRTSEQFCSGIYRCSSCGRVHIHVRGTQNQWQSFLPEGRMSGR